MIKLLVSAAIILTACSAEQVSAHDSESELLENTATGKILKRGFNRLMKWFPGRYDNVEQVYFEGNLKVPKRNIMNVFTASLPVWICLTSPILWRASIKKNYPEYTPPEARDPHFNMTSWKYYKTVKDGDITLPER